MTDLHIIANQLSTIYHATPDGRKDEKAALMKAWEGIEQYMAITHRGRI